MIPLLVAAVLALATTTAVLASVRPALVKRAHLPDGADLAVVSEPTFRAGGVALAAGLLTGLLAYTLTGGALSTTIWLLVASVIAVAAIGLYADYRPLRTAVSLLGQAIVLGLPLAWVVGNSRTISLGVAAVLLLVGLLYVNSTTIVDDAQGMAELNGPIAGLYFVIIALRLQEPSVLALALVVACVFLAFLPWNALSERLTLGNAGSFVLGGSVWALFATAVILGVPSFLAAAPLLVYAAEAVVAVVRWLLRGRPHVERINRAREIQIGRFLTLGGAITHAFNLACCFIGWWGYFNGPSLLVGAILYAVAAVGALLPVVIGMFLIPKEPG